MNRDDMLENARKFADKCLNPQNSEELNIDDYISFLFFYYKMLDAITLKNKDENGYVCYCTNSDSNQLGQRKIEAFVRTFLMINNIEVNKNDSRYNDIRIEGNSCVNDFNICIYWFHMIRNKLAHGQYNLAGDRIIILSNNNKYIVPLYLMEDIVGYIYNIKLLYNGDKSFLQTQFLKFFKKDGQINALKDERNYINNKYFENNYYYDNNHMKKTNQINGKILRFRELIEIIDTSSSKFLSKSLVNDLFNYVYTPKKDVAYNDLINKLHGELFAVKDSNNKKAMIIIQEIIRILSITKEAETNITNVSVLNYLQILLDQIDFQEDKEKNPENYSQLNIPLHNGLFQGVVYSQCFRFFQDKIVELISNEYKKIENGNGSLEDFYNFQTGILKIIGGLKLTIINHIRNCVEHARFKFQGDKIIISKPPEQNIEVFRVETNARQLFNICGEINKIGTITNDMLSEQTKKDLNIIVPNNYKNMLDEIITYYSDTLKK